MLEWRELSGREGSAMLSEWQGEDRAEEEETAPSCRVEVEPIAVEQPEAVTVDEREASDDIEFFLGKQKKTSTSSRADRTIFDGGKLSLDAWAFRVSSRPSA